MEGGSGAGVRAIGAKGARVPLNVYALPQPNPNSTKWDLGLEGGLSTEGQGKDLWLLILRI